AGADRLDRCDRCRERAGLHARFIFGAQPSILGKDLENLAKQRSTPGLGIELRNPSIEPLITLPLLTSDIREQGCEQLATVWAPGPGTQRAQLSVMDGRIDSVGFQFHKFRQGKAGLLDAA